MTSADQRWPSEGCSSGWSAALSLWYCLMQDRLSQCRSCPIGRSLKRTAQESKPLSATWHWHKLCYDKRCSDSKSSCSSSSNTYLVIHQFFCNCLSFAGLQWGWSRFELIVSKWRGTSWTSHQVITGLTFQSNFILFFYHGLSFCQSKRINSAKLSIDQIGNQTPKHNKKSGSFSE